MCVYSLFNERRWLHDAVDVVRDNGLPDSNQDS